MAEYQFVLGMGNPMFCRGTKPVLSRLQEVWLSLAAEEITL